MAIVRTTSSTLNAMLRGDAVIRDQAECPGGTRLAGRGDRWMRRSSPVFPTRPAAARGRLGTGTSRQFAEELAQVFSAIIIRELTGQSR
jgi:hypothetical protein